MICNGCSPTKRSKSAVPITLLRWTEIRTLEYGPQA